MPIYQQFLIAAAMIAALVLGFYGLHRMGLATERDLRQQARRMDAHMRQCRIRSGCYHPDHVHSEPEPDWCDEHIAALEEIRRPHGFWERMGS